MTSANMSGGKHFRKGWVAEVKYDIKDIGSQRGQISSLKIS